MIASGTSTASLGAVVHLAATGGGVDALVQADARVFSPNSRANRAVAPMVEQRSPKPRVVGSSPACPAAVDRVGVGVGNVVTGA